MIGFDANRLFALECFVVILRRSTFMTSFEAQMRIFAFISASSILLATVAIRKLIPLLHESFHWGPPDWEHDLIAKHWEPEVIEPDEASDSLIVFAQAAH